MNDFGHSDATLFSNAPIVIDNGASVIKAGFAGQELPSCLVPAIVGRPKHCRVMAGAIEGETFVGTAAQGHRGLLRLDRPTANGNIEDWNHMEALLANVFEGELRCRPEDHAVLLTDRPLTAKRQRDHLAQLLFETFNVPALHLAMPSVLSLYASGKTSGLVLDCGEDSTCTVPIVDGFAIEAAIRRVDVGGRNITDYLQMLLRKNGHSFGTSAEWYIVQQIKEKLCQLERSPAAAAGLVTAHTGSAAEELFTMPDGRVIRIGTERFRAPELLFNPSLMGFETPGVGDLLWESIQLSDVELRQGLQSAIVLSGGSTLVKGFGDRLLAELRSARSPSGLGPVKLKIYAPPERKYSPWIGGSILASLATFRKMVVTAAEYRENPDIIAARFSF